MKKGFFQLSKNEIATLLKAPAIASFLAAIKTGEINQWRKVEAIKLAHLKTLLVSCSPIIIKKRKSFNGNNEMIVNGYVPKDKINGFFNRQLFRKSPCSALTYEVRSLQLQAKQYPAE